MAGVGGKLCSLLLLSMALLLALSTATRAEEQQLGRALGVGKDGDRCCSCACDRRVPELSMCACGGKWEGGCPSVCSKCECDDDDVCHCSGGFNIKYYDCQRDSCYSDGASGSAFQGDGDVM